MKKSLSPGGTFNHLLQFTRLLFICTAVLFTGSSLKAQCIGATPVNGSSSVNDNSLSGVDFNNPGNAVGSDGSWATSTAIVSLFTGNSNYLKVTGYGFNLPSYAIICGVEVLVEKKAAGLGIGAWVRDNEIKLVKGGTISGNNKAVTGADWGTSAAVYTYGGPTDTWGTTLSVSDVNNSGFGVALSASFNGLLFVFPSAQVNNIQIKLYYNLILPTHIVSFNSTLKNNVAQLKWKTAGEEAGEFISLQRSKDGSSKWNDIARFEMHTAGDGQEYSYNDILDSKGNYSYRLRMTGNTGIETYSAIKLVNYTESGFANAYPNPSSDYIIITNPDGISSLVVCNAGQQLFKPPYELMNKNTARVNISLLPQGIYFASAGGKQIRFLKK